MRGKVTREVWSARVKVNAFSEAGAICAALDWASEAEEKVFEFESDETEGGARARLEMSRRQLESSSTREAGSPRGFWVRVDWATRVGEGPGGGALKRRRELSWGEAEEAGRLWGDPDAVEAGNEEGGRRALAAATRAAGERDEMDRELGRGAAARGAERL